MQILRSQKIKELLENIHAIKLESKDRMSLRNRLSPPKLCRHTGIPGLWMQVLDARLWTLDSRLWTLHFGRWALYTGHCHCLVQSRIKTQESTSFDMAIFRDTQFETFSSGP